MGVSKVIYNTENGAEVLMDLTGDTVTPDKLASGVTAHGANGELITGTATEVNIVQITGTSTTDVMSQAAVTNELDDLSKEIVDQREALSGYALKSEIPTISVESVNGKTGVVVLGAEDVGATTESWVQAKINDLKAQGVQQVPALAQGDTLEECLAWLEENGDASKTYVMKEGISDYIYGYIETEISGGGYTNILDTETVTLNSRYSSSESLKTANGYIAIDYFDVKPKDVIRFKPASIAQGVSGGYHRFKLYNPSKTIVSVGDIAINEEYTLTVKDNVASLTIPTTSSYANAAYARANLYIASGVITQDNLEGVVVTINEEIIEPVNTVGYAWASTGRTFTPADYEDRIVELENKVDELETITEQHEAEISSLKENGGNSLLDSIKVYAPSPQLPADGSSTADFNSETVTTEQIYAYIDALVTKYPKYITKEVLGKDETGNHDWCRYVLSRRAYDAWLTPNYPAMYAWVNGSTVIYSKSVSPRIGDTLYTTKYIGTAKGTVTSVSNANQTRTVGGVVYTRDKTKDVEPTLVFTETYYSPYYVGAYAGFKNGVYNSSKTKISTISTYSADSMTSASGVTYKRYPLGDRNSSFEKLPVIVIGSNEHGRQGDPAEPAIISARMIKDLCECKQMDNPFLNLLKNDYMMVFCPVINPWGLSRTDGGYVNGNGVNIDRNFDTVGWGNDTDTRHGAYGGSENETQYFMNTLVESGAKIAMANHGLGTHLNTSTGESANAGHCHYMLGRNKSKYSEYLLEIGETMGANYNLAFSDYGQAPPETYAKTRSYIDAIGAEGGAVEMQGREGFVLAGEGNLHTARILEADYTLLLQFLHMLLVCQET